ncbi:MAG: aminotransferase class I/II-fold pyridoxal phosphate-dependent enzyme [Chloroflexota bacterium]|nr:aminotransferase class I/II-fold pyridoxal phosphate-dependent enzyme [Chloroflexota bacterium]
MFDLLSYSLADFHYNDNPNVLLPPEDFDSWVNHPLLADTFSCTGYQLATSPGTTTYLLDITNNDRIKVINLSSLNYLGLSYHPEVIQAAKVALDQYGLGSAGVPLVGGTFDLHLDLARKLAEFKQKEDCILYSSGFGGNVGALQGVLRRDDVLILDEKCHKSMVDGGTLSGAKMLFFDHNDPEHLATILETHSGKRILVGVEGVYSVDGDLARLDEIIQVCDQYQAATYIDEAHSNLIFGPNGRGVAEYFGVEDKIGMTFGTLSKSFGVVGGFVCSNARIIRYLKGYSPPWLYSTTPPPPVIAGLIKELEIATRDSSLRDRVLANASYMRKSLLDMKLDIGCSQSHIIPIMVGSSGEKLFNLAAEVRKRGLLLMPIDYPAVPAHLRRFRLSVSAMLTKEEMDTSLNIIEDVIAKALRAEEKKS